MNCPYCGLKAGWFRSYHVACKARIEAGRIEIARLVDEALERADVRALSSRIKEITDRYFLSTGVTKNAALDRLRASLQDIGSDRLIQASDRTTFAAVAGAFDLPPSTCRDIGVDAMIEMGRALLDIRAGKYPANVPSRGVVMQKGERPIWCFERVAYHKDRIKRVSVRHSAWISTPIGRGGSRVGFGTSCGEMLERLETTAVDTGLLLVTDRHLYFRGPQAATKIPYAKIISTESFTNGFGVFQNTARANWQFFVTDQTDGWLLTRLIEHITSEGYKDQ